MNPEKDLVSQLWSGLYFAIVYRRSRRRKIEWKSGHASRFGMMTKVMRCFMLIGKFFMTN
jgi:hypothetical protein